MPLRVTVELIPRGDETQKRKLAVFDIENDGTGDEALGNYIVRGEGEVFEGGWDGFHGFPVRIEGVRRFNPDRTGCGITCVYRALIE